jgi:phosphoribosylanthranilate isomerase
VFVKVCGITVLDDALAAAGAGADAIGLIFAESPRRVTVEVAAAVVSALPRGVRAIGVFRSTAATEVLRTVRAAGLGGVQLHDPESPDAVTEIRRSVPFVLVATAGGSQECASAERWRADAVLVDAAVPGSGSAWEWSRFRAPSGPVRVVLAGGLGPDNVALGIAAVRPWGVDASSALEDSPGRKNHAAVRRFVTAAKSAAGTLSPC